MQKVGLYSLLALLAFALVFALLPGSAGNTTQTGATLQGVQLALYPSRDPDAIWQFQAAQVQSDPLTGTTELSGLSGGQRLLRVRDSAGKDTGQTVLDATLNTGKLSINNQDDIVTSQATLHLVKECADVTLSGNPEQPVKIEQGVGFSAPVTTLNSPDMSARVSNLQMDFNFNVLASGQMEMTGNLDAKEQCVNGKRVPRA